MISSTVTEGSDRDLAVKVFKRINTQAQNYLFPESSEVYIFRPVSENFYFYNAPENNKPLNLIVGTPDKAGYSLNTVYQDSGCLAAVLLSSPYKPFFFEKTAAEVLKREDTEDYVYRIIQGESIYCSGQRIGTMGLPEHGLIKFSYFGEKQLRGNTLNTVRTLVRVFLENAEMVP